MLVAGGVITGNYQNAADSTVIISNTNQITGNYQKGTGISISGNTISQDPSYAIGDQLQGGTIFYLDETKQHGLMLARPYEVQQTTASIKPTSVTLTTAYAFATGIGGGMINTQYWLAAFQANSPGTSFAGTFIETIIPLSLTSDGVQCSDTSLETCYGEYYLPSLNESQILRLSGIVQSVDCGAGGTSAWTSSSDASSVSGAGEQSDKVFFIDMSNGNAISSPLSTGTSGPLCIFPIRQF